MTASGRNSKPGAPLASLPEGQGCSVPGLHLELYKLKPVAPETYVRKAIRDPNMACVWMKRELSRRRS